MVHEANLKQATAEKQLKEALGKVSYADMTQMSRQHFLYDNKSMS